MENWKCDDNNVIHLYMFLYFIFVKLFFFIWSNIIPNLYIRKKRLSEIGRQMVLFPPPHLSRTLSLLLYLLWLFYGYLSGCIFFFHFHIWLKTYLISWLSFSSSAHLHTLSFSTYHKKFFNQVRAWVWIALLYESHEYKILVYYFAHHCPLFSNICKVVFSSLRAWKTYLRELVKLADSWALSQELSRVKPQCLYI